MMFADFCTTRDVLMSTRKKIHLVCNAHLDPVWQWTWEDGLTEAISTFRIAADFCEQHPEFVFNHNESVLYLWIMQYDKPLFDRIVKLVKQKQWHIAGGAFLQPDVNTPTGESHIRQFLYGLSFFREHFKARPTVAYNFDPFGHPEGFAQILSGCGMDAYIFCRPDHGTYPLPLGSFIWQDRSGSTVLARRSDDHYLTRPGSGHDVEVKFPQFVEHYKDEPATMILWGIGNHGGGISHAEYKQLQTFIKKHPELDVIHSTPEAFFEEIRNTQNDFPTVQGEIERSFPGCYTSMHRVKQAHREAEHLMLQTETMAALAWWAGDSDYPQQQLDEAWQDILFCEFHDILPGSGIPKVEADALAQLGHAHTILRKLRFGTMVQLLQGQAKAAEGQVPIFITNPHGYRVKQQVEFEYSVAAYDRNDHTIVLKHNGRTIPYQQISPQNNLSCQMVVRLAVDVDLQPYQIMRLDASLKPVKPATPVYRKATKSNLCFETKLGTIQINPATGLIDSIIPKGQTRSLVKKNALIPALFEDLDHSWTCGDPKRLKDAALWSQGPVWEKPDRFFALATSQQTADLSPLACDKWGKVGKTNAKPIRVIEDSKLRTTVEATFVCDASAIIRHYVICHRSGRVEVRDRVLFNHKDHMLKLLMPLNFAPEHSSTEAAYSVTYREPTPLYEELPNQRWTMASADDGRYVGLINSSSYGHNLTQDTLAISVLRSPAYTSFNIQPNHPLNDNRFTPRQDQGEQEVRYELCWGTKLDEQKITQQAAVFNAGPFAYVYYPDNSQPASRTMQSDACSLSVTPDHVQIVAVKKAQHEDAMVVRLQEVAGKKAQGAIQLAGYKPVPIEVKPFGLATWLIRRKGKTIEAQPCNLVEGL
jgi:alpha-mannosidase